MIVIFMKRPKTEQNIDSKTLFILILENGMFFPSVHLKVGLKNMFTFGYFFGLLKEDWFLPNLMGGKKIILKTL